MAAAASIFLDAVGFAFLFECLTAPKETRINKVTSDAAAATAAAAQTTPSHEKSRQTQSMAAAICLATSCHPNLCFASGHALATLSSLASASPRTSSSLAHSCLWLLRSSFYFYLPATTLTSFSSNLINIIILELYPPHHRQESPSGRLSFSTFYHRGSRFIPHPLPSFDRFFAPSDLLFAHSKARSSD
ncbi:uncharacterized protein UDID_18288 [Ustilago sp. UG-2017a]|nr:uncharacterized protein UDID_18288 [Ustilago sp. UG-2017a]